MKDWSRVGLERSDEARCWGERERREKRGGREAAKKVVMRESIEERRCDSRRDTRDTMPTVEEDTDQWLNVAAGAAGRYSARGLA